MLSSATPMRESARGRRAAEPARALALRQPAPAGAPKAGACACGGSCPRCRAKAAYDVTQPGDAAERAADAMAHAALSADARPGRDGAKPATARALDAPSELVPGSGEALAPAVRSEFEARFGADFSAVRVHRDARAARAADALAAHAYAVGSDIAFAGGRYAPQTPAGRRLLAHELAHVVQHARDPAPVIARQGDEPLIPIPVFDELDICGEVEGRRLCGSDLKKACEIVPSLPICGLFKKKGRKPKPKPAPCPPGFRAGTASGFEGMCCQGEIHSAQSCCPPERITTGSPFLRCCPPGTQPDAEKKDCEKPAACPPEQQAFGGRCCEPPLVPKGFACVEPEKKKTPPKEKPPPKPAVETVLTTAIAFERDRPQSWYNPAAAYGVSVTGKGKTAFDALVELLATDVALKVRLAGNASIEKPADDPQYNQRLTERRVQLIARELERRGIDRTRIADPSDAPSLPGCEELDDGIHACGDTGAAETTEASDRNVAARVFREGA